MEVLLLTDIPGIGRKNDLIVVKRGFALNKLLPGRQAIVVTPHVRRQYAEHIKARALEREKERALAASLSSALTGVVIHVTAKATKTGKLYAAMSAEMIAEALKSEHAVDIPVTAIALQDHIKTVGTHTVNVTIGAQTAAVQLEVKAEE